ncbi:MAG: hypothetical protein ACK5NK_15635 [Niabella sp.]
MQNPNHESQGIFDLNFSDENNIGLTNQNTLRKVVGILGMLLPFLVWLFVYIDSGYSNPMDSLSHYYFTRAGSIFCIAISLLAVFLMIYKGKDPIDFYLSFTAGLSAFCVVLFPTDSITNICCDTDKKYVVTILKESGFRVGFHYTAAGIFLLCLAFMSLFLFTRSNKKLAFRTKNKLKRNLLYRTCGITMLLCMLVIFLGGFTKLIPEEIYNKNNITFWMETLAIEAFGISWLVKGEAILKD